MEFLCQIKRSNFVCLQNSYENKPFENEPFPCCEHALINDNSDFLRIMIANSDVMCRTFFFIILKVSNKLSSLFNYSW